MFYPLRLYSKSIPDRLLATSRRKIPKLREVGSSTGGRKGRTAGLTGMKPKETVVEGSGEESWKCFGEEERIGVRLFRLLPCGRRCG